jgi:hypothetical protein
VFCLQAGPAARGFRGQAARRHVLHGSFLFTYFRTGDENDGLFYNTQIADDLDAKCRELEELDRKLQRLRSEQDRAAAAGEGALKLRLKREELFAKEERMAALLAAKRPAMRDVFGGDADIPVRLFF